MKRQCQDAEDQQLESASSLAGDRPGVEKKKRGKRSRLHLSERGNGERLVPVRYDDRVIAVDHNVVWEALLHVATCSGQVRELRSLECPPAFRFDELKAKNLFELHSDTS